MENVLIYERVMCETKEILKYLEPNILNKIPDKVKKYIENNSSTQYTFKIDKSKRLVEQNLLKETQEFMSLLYLEYCCEPDEKQRLLEVCIENEQKQFKYKTVEEMFKKKEVTNPNMQLMVVEEKETLWSRLCKKIKEIFKIKKR